MSCIVCHEEIKPNATRCLHCGSYQVGWRNWLPVVGTLATIIALVGSAAVVVTATATDIWKELLGKDAVEVIEYTDGHLTILNSGSRALLIEHVFERSDTLNYSKVIPIHKVVAEGHVLRTPSGPMSDEVSFPVTNVTDEEWDKMKSGKVGGVEPYFYSKDAPGLATLSEHLGDHLRTFEATCGVRFRPVVPGSERKDQSFACVGILIKQP